MNEVDEQRLPTPEARARDAASQASQALGGVRWLAALSIPATLLGRAIRPALAGAGVGLGRAIGVVEIVDGFLAQLFVLFGTVGTIALILVAMRSRLSWWMRAAAMTLGGPVMLLCISASAVPVAGTTQAAIGTVVSVLALVAAWEARTSPLARKVAAALAATGVASLLHIAAVGATYVVKSQSTGLALSRSLSTASFLFEAVALVVALSWLPPARRGPPKLTSAATLVVVGAAFVLTRQVLLADKEDAGFLAVLLRRAVDRLATQPDPYYFTTARVFGALLAPLVAIAALFKPGQLPAVAGAVALLLIARGAPEAPLSALGLAIASLGLAIAARDERGVWAAISASKGEFRG